ncbi:hypothetical protein [Nocardia carnea]|uniref:hypothetical protein n=1 Tax=Nocardia carnea TaxID=37328 RepID=UPI00245722FF|nr:hypothetical protein [Nocardia carnea]
MTGHRTGSAGRPWIELERPKPPKITDEMLYWADRPPELSERCRYWVRQLERGWLPNRRISMKCYHCSAVWYGVYLWEYLNVLAPLIASERGENPSSAR